MVKEELQLFIRQIDAKLLKTVYSKIFKSKNVKNTWKKYTLVKYLHTQKKGKLLEGL